MKNGLKFIHFTGWLAITTLLSLTLFACGGGSDDDDSNSGGEEVIVPVVDYAERALVTINSVVENTDHTVTVHFSATNENDVALIGLTEPRFTVAKLVPEQDTKPSEWVSFINSAKTGDDPSGTSVTVLQATYDQDSKNAEGRFTDKGNGTYSFKLKETVLTAVNPISHEPIAWDATATHRVGMQISANSNNTVNATYDWVPAGGNLIDMRNMVDSETCNSCHGELKLHGSRVEAQYCVTCHNPGSIDPESGNTVDFTPMIHKIHRGAELPSMAKKGDGAVYEIIGYRGSVHTYAKNVAGAISGVELPQDIRNCSNCHTATNEATPQGDNWTTNASVVACTSCHDDIAFSQAEIDTDLNMAGKPWKRAHSNGFVEADSCTSCHGANSGNTSPAYAHETVRKQAKSAADNLSISIERVARVGSAIEVDLNIKLYGAGIESFAKLTDPNGDADKADSMLLSKKGYLLVNNDQGDGYELSYGAIQVDIEQKCAADGAGLFTCIVTDSGTTGVLSLVTTEMPICANGKSAGGDLISCNSIPDAYTQVEYVPAYAVKGYYNLSDLSVADNYVEKIGADMAKCQNCHDGDGFHMTRHAATDLAQCTNCHNATRASFYAGRPADLKSHVHTLHSNNDSSHPLEAYPNNVATCTACHTDTQYDLNPDTLINKRSSAASLNSRDPAMPVTYSSPAVTVCASCHIKDMPVGLIAADGTMDAARQAGLSESDVTENNKWIAHMQKYGGAFGQFDMDAADVAPELCASCHAKGEDKGVDAVHGL